MVTICVMLNAKGSVLDKCKMFVSCLMLDSIYILPMLFDI